jgi:TRAP transporter TAXI family solute receptor
MAEELVEASGTDTAPGESRSRPRWWLRALVGVALLLALGLAGWSAMRERVPGEVVIASGARGGLYYRLAEALATRMSARLGRPVRVLATNGTAENRERLLRGEAHLGIFQTGAAPLDQIAVLAPLYPDVVHVVARKGRGIASLGDLAGRRVAIGAQGSGMRILALQLLRLHGVGEGQLKGGERYFTELLTDRTLDAAVVTTGVLNPDLARTLADPSLELVPIPNGEALAVHHHFLSPFTIPRAVFGARPAVPPADVPTVTTTAVLVGPTHIHPAVVRAALECLYEEDLRAEFPVLLPASEAKAWPVVRLHEKARAYFDPYEGLDTISGVLESLSAGKELLFTLGAALYLAWTRWRALRERERERAMAKAKERLDFYLNETVRIERAQIGCWDRPMLLGYLAEVTRIKLDALESLTTEDLRGDRLFLIFLTQCASLIQKMQLKLEIGDPNATNVTVAGRPPIEV